MQTFLPFESYTRSARALDNSRLGKQRVETLQILNVLTGYRIGGTHEEVQMPSGRIKKVPLSIDHWYLDPSAKGWGNHPMTRMWEGYELSLLHYGLVVCRVWTRERHSADTCFAKMRFLFPGVTMADITSSTKPEWLGNEDLHVSHQANLVDKGKQYYLHHADRPHRPHGQGSRKCDGATPHKPHRTCDPKLMWRHYRPQFPDVPVARGTDPVAIPYVWPV